MRIIENNYKGKERTIICPHCSSVIAYEWDSLDRHITKSGMSYICCGACHEAIYINENDAPSDEIDDTPTINTVQYPKDFYSFEKCLNCLDKDNDYSCISSGDTAVIAYKSDENSSVATVIVAKKYQETDVKIPRKNF